MTESRASPNGHERDKPGTNARSAAQEAIESLRQRGGIFVDAVRATRMAMALTDPTLPGNPIVFANQSFLDLTGYSMDEVLGQQPHFMNGPDTDPEDAERFRRILETDRDGVVETVQYAKDGRRFVATVLLSAFRDDDGRTQNHFLSWADVTRRIDAEKDATDLRATQASLRESEARHRLLIGSWAQAVWETNPEGLVVTDSPSWRTYTGQTLEEWLGHGWLDAVHPDDRAYAERQWREAMAARSHVDAEFRLRTAAGGWRWTNVRAAPVLDADGHIEKWAGMNIDVNASKRVEAALRESEERHAFLLALSDALRPLDTLSEIAQTATARLREKLDITRVAFGEIEGECLNVETDSTHGVRSIVGKHPLEAFGLEYLAGYKTGAVIVVEDIDRDPRLTEGARAGLREREVASFADAILLEEGGKISLLAVQCSAPRAWSPAELTLIMEVGERVGSALKRTRAETALRNSEERLRRFGEASQDILWIRDAETLQWTYLTPAFERIYGLSREEALKGDNYHSWLDLIVAEDREHARQEIGKVLSGEPVTFEYRIRRPSDGAIRRLRNTDFPIADDTGRIVMIGGIGHDVTELRESEERRRTSEERFGLIVENARDYAIFTTDPDGRIDHWYEGAAAVFGWTEGEAVGRLAEITFTPEDRAAGEAAKEREAAARKGRVPNVRWHIRKDGRRIFIEGIASALRDGNGELTGFLKIGQDVTERRRAQERQNTLLAELQHRVRNIMAMIRSVARRTGDTAETVEAYVQHLEGRISAMARTQALLTRDVNAAVDLHNLLLDELGMQAAQPEQYKVTGPDVSLPPKAAEVLGLALHELATNSVKYGALSEDNGRIDVRWALLDGEETRQLSLIWSEFGVSIGGEPSRQGFGTELITQRVPYELQGTGTIEFRPTGLVATLEFPLQDLPSILQTDEGKDRSS